MPESMSGSVRKLAVLLLIVSMALPRTLTAQSKPEDPPDPARVAADAFVRDGWGKIGEEPIVPEETVKEKADRKIQKIAGTLPFHVGQTFLMLSTISAMAAIDHVKNVERLTGESAGYSQEQIIKLAATAIANDPTIWSGLGGALATEKVLEPSLGYVQQALVTKAGSQTLAMILQSAIGTTVAFFGWEMGRHLLHMACRLDTHDVRDKSGIAVPLTFEEADRMENKFLEVLASPVLLAIQKDALEHGRDTGKHFDDLVQAGKDMNILPKVLKNMFYILFADEKLRATWFDVTLRLGLFTGDTLLFAAAMSASSIVGSAVGTAMQPFVPIPGTTLLVGFLFTIGGAYAAFQVPPATREEISEAIWGFRETFYEGQKGALDALARRMDAGNSNIDSILEELRRVRQGRALIVIEKINASLKQLGELDWQIRAAQDTIKKNRRPHPPNDPRELGYSVYRESADPDAFRSHAPAVSMTERRLPESGIVALEKFVKTTTAKLEEYQASYRELRDELRSEQTRIWEETNRRKRDVLTERPSVSFYQLEDLLADVGDANNELVTDLLNRLEPEESAFLQDLVPISNLEKKENPGLYSDLYRYQIEAFQTLISREKPRLVTAMGAVLSEEWLNQYLFPYAAFAPRGFLADLQAKFPEAPGLIDRVVIVSKLENELKKILEMDALFQQLGAWLGASGVAPIGKLIKERQFALASTFISILTFERVNDLGLSDLDAKISSRIDREMPVQQYSDN